MIVFPGLGSPRHAGRQSTRPPLRRSGVHVQACCTVTIWRDGSRKRISCYCRIHTVTRRLGHEHTHAIVRIRARSVLACPCARARAMGTHRRSRGSPGERVRSLVVHHTRRSFGWWPATLLLGCPASGSGRPGTPSTATRRRSSTAQAGKSRQTNTRGRKRVLRTSAMRGAEQSASQDWGLWSELTVAGNHACRSCTRRFG